MKTFLLLFLSVVVARAELVREQVGLTSFKGDVSVKSPRGESRRVLTNGDDLREGDELITSLDATAELTFSNGVRVIVAPGSSLRLAMSRQVNPPTAIVPRLVGQQPGEGSIADLILGSGSVTVVCPSLSDRSLVVVRTEQWSSDLSRRGVYVLNFHRAAEGELVTQAVALVGSLVFTPAGKGQGRPVMVESGNRLSVTSDSSLLGGVSFEKLKMGAKEVEELLKEVPSVLSTQPALVAQPKAVQSAMPPRPLSAPPGSSTSSAGVSTIDEIVKAVTQGVIERQGQVNPSPTGG